MSTQPFENLIPQPNILTFQTSKSHPLEFFLPQHKNPIYMDQCHSNTVTTLTDPKDILHPLPQTDAVITTIPDILLLVKTADCLPILISHPYPLIAAIHAGRVGTDLNIFKKTLLHIQSRFGITKDLSIWFGPHISEKNYEINAEEKMHYNLSIKNKTQLLKAFPKNAFTLFELNKCTVANNGDFFSYRKEKTKKRHYSAIKIKGMLHHEQS